MNYNQFHLTKDGLDLLNRTTTGERLIFTRVALGTGNVNSVEEMIGLKDLIDQRLSVGINKIENNHDGTCTMTVPYSNKELTKGFIIKEIGVFAEDPIKGEILYLIANSGEEADFLPAHSTNEVEIVMEIIVIVGDAAEIIVNIDNSMIFATRDELLDLAGDGRTDETVKKNADDILRMSLEFASFKGSTINGMGENTFFVVFDDFADEEEYEGVWDREKSRLGIYPTSEVKR